MDQILSATNACCNCFNTGIFILHIDSSDLRLSQATTEASKNKYFAELDSIGTDAAASADPISDWLSAPAIANVSDPIAWWTAMDAAGHPLARMSLDFLSAPGTFVYF